MIDPATGQVFFQDGLTISVHCLVQSLFGAGPRRSYSLPGSFWKWHALGLHPSDHGPFEVEVVSRHDNRVQGVYLVHVDLKYDRAKGSELERGAHHEAVIAADLKGQREFWWGEVGCNRAEGSKDQWLLIAYNQGPQVPELPQSVTPHLAEHEPALPNQPKREG